MTDREPIAPDERTAILVALAEVRGQITQVLAFVTNHEARLNNHSERLRAVENTQAQARGRTTVLAMIGGGAVSLVVVILFKAIGG